MAYNTPKRENLPIEKPTINCEFALVKYQIKNEYSSDAPKLYLVGNPNHVSITFNDLVAVTHQNQGNGDATLPAQTAKVVAMFNDVTNTFFNKLLNKGYAEFLGELPVAYHGESIICNITDPMNPKGSNTGGNNVNDSDENGEQISSSPSTSGGNDGSDGNNGSNSSSGKGGKQSGGRVQFIVNFPKDDKDSNGKNNEPNGNEGYTRDDEDATDRINKEVQEMNDEAKENKERFTHIGKFIKFTTGN